MRIRWKQIFTAQGIVAGALSIVLAIAGTKIANAAASYTLVSLDATVTGTSVTTKTTVKSSYKVSTSQYGVCARSASNANVDFNLVSAKITTRGTSYTSKPKTFAPGTYTYFACLFAEGRWNNVGASKQFTVGRVLSDTTLSTSNVTSAQVTLQWTPVSGANGYRVGYQATAAGDPAWETTDAASATSRVFTGLRAETTYTFYVQPLSGGNVKTIQATTLASVNPDPEPGTASRADYAGISEPYHQWSGLSTATINSRMAKLAETGVKWFRMDLPAVFIETNQNVRDWTVADKIQAAAEANGMQVIWCITTLPAWSASSWDVGPTTSAQRTAYANFAAAAVTHFKNHEVGAWELWNEPNLSSFWTNPNVSQYAQLIAATYPAIKAADSSAYVLTGGTAWNDTGVLKQDKWYIDLYAIPGAKNNFDGVAVHPYADSWYCSSSYGCFTGGNMGNVSNVRATMNAYGDAAKKIWTTETGFPTGRADVGDANQATWLTSLYSGWYDQTTDRGATGPMMWYSGFDTGTSGSEPTFGIIRTNGTTKPAFTALKNWING